MSAPCAGDLGAARTRVRAALAAGGAADRDDALELRLTAAWLDIERGAPLAGVALLDELEPLAGNRFRGRVALLRGLCDRAGGAAGAAASLDAAVAALRGDEPYWLAEALLARAGDAARHPVDADADLVEAGGLFTAAGAPQRAAYCTHQRGCVAYRDGDLPAALALFDRAAHDGLHAESHPEVLLDRAEVSLAVGLIAEARRLLERAVELLGACDRLARLAEAVLVAARCALRAGDLRTAASTADIAGRLFTAQHRPSWACAARAVGAVARLRTGESGAVRIADAVRLAAECADRGWPEHSAELWLAAAPVCGSARTARSLLVAVAWQRDGATARLRELGWLATARLAQHDGDAAGALRAAHAGLPAGTGTPDGGSAESVALAEIGLAAARHSGDPAAVLAWTERVRALAEVRRAPTDSAPAAALADALVALRAAEPGDALTTAARDRRAAAESAVRRVTASAGGHAVMSTMDGAALAAGLGERVLLSFFRVGDSVHAVSVHNGCFAEHAVGGLADVERAVRQLRFAHLLWLRTGGERAGRAMRRCAAELDRMLFARLPDAPATVLVPTAPLHAVPFSALPSLRGRAVSLVPSAASWLRAAACPAGTGTVLVAGPDLAHADDELAALAALPDDPATVLTGSASTVDATLAVLDGAELAHLVAHGRFRADQPLFSTLRLADGPLYGHDLLRVRRAPRRVVLAACESGLAATRHGRCFGLATALLDAGSATVVASVAPVPDDGAVELMRTLHAQLHRGVPAAEALALAQATHGDLGFVAVGA